MTGPGDGLAGRTDHRARPGGYLLIESQNDGRTDRLLLAIVLLAVLGEASDAVLGLVEPWAVRRWT